MAVNRLYTLRQVALMWNLSIWTIRGMVARREIRPIVGIGRGWMFDGGELERVTLERL